MPYVRSVVELLQFVGKNYDRKDPRFYDQPAQVALKSSSETFGHLIPLGFKVGHSGLKPFSLTVTPWIGFRDPDESSSFQNGIYVVYLFDADLGQVHLSLNQGTEDLKKKLKMRASERIQLLRSNAAKIRARLSSDEIAGLHAEIDLKTKQPRAMSYMAGNVVSLSYVISNLPSSEQMESDLSRFFDLFARAVQIRNSLLLEGDDDFLGEIPRHQALEDLALCGFNPKSDLEYVVELKAATIVKSRRHEKIVKLFGEFAMASGFGVITPDPMDVLLTRDGSSWIVEAKIVYDLNFAQAVRSAIGQLMDYRHFLLPDARLIALFDRPIGEPYIGLLRSLGISVVCLEGQAWKLDSDEAQLVSNLNT